jgi:hypothetical protein
LNDYLEDYLDEYLGCFVVALGAACSFFERAGQRGIIYIPPADRLPKISANIS